MTEVETPDQGKLAQLLSFRPAQDLLHPRTGRADTPLPARSPRTGAPVPVTTWTTTLAPVVSNSARGFLLVFVNKLRAACMRPGVQLLWWRAGNWAVPSEGSVGPQDSLPVAVSCWNLLLWLFRTCLVSPWWDDIYNVMAPFLVQPQKLRLEPSLPTNIRDHRSGQPSWLELH